MSRFVISPTDIESSSWQFNEKMTSSISSLHDNKTCKITPNRKSIEPKICVFRPLKDYYCSQGIGVIGRCFSKQIGNIASNGLHQIGSSAFPYRYLFNLQATSLYYYILTSVTQVTRYFFWYCCVKIRQFVAHSLESLFLKESNRRRSTISTLFHLRQDCK